MLASIIIRTYNESKHLPDLLREIQKQTVPKSEYEVIVVDSGSTDDTISIAKSYSAKIVHIKKEEFSFGRSLNIGCKAAQGDNLIFISGHCIPVQNDWLDRITRPLSESQIAYTYGRQVGDHTSRFSECQLFKKFYPETSKIPQEGSCFCNNANAALRRDVWIQEPFDEELTGLEDMELAQRLVKQKHSLAYIAEAPVYHLHNETWHSVRMRYEREAIALQIIKPHIHISFIDFLRYLTSAVMLDFGAAIEARGFRKIALQILRFRFTQYWGTYRGNNEHRRLSKSEKEEYFYPV